MSQPLGVILKQLALKLDLNYSNNNFLEELLKLDTPVNDETFNLLKNGIDGLMSESEARTDTEISRHFKAITLAPIDRMLAEMLESGGFDEEFKNGFKAKGSTYDNLRRVFSKASELEHAQRSGKTIDQAKLQEEINRFNKEIENVRAQAEGERLRLKEESENAILNYALGAALEAKNYANQSLPKKVNALTALTLLQQELSTKQAKVIRSADGSLKLVCSDSPEADYTENNKPISFGDFADSLLAKHNMLKVTEPRSTVNNLSQKQFVAVPSDQRNELAYEANHDNLAALEKALGK